MGGAGCSLPGAAPRAHLHKYSHESASYVHQRTEIAAERAHEFGLSASINNARNQRRGVAQKRRDRKDETAIPDAECLHEKPLRKSPDR